MTGDTDTVSLSLEVLSAAVPTNLMVQPIICYGSGGGSSGRSIQKTGVRYRRSGREDRAGPGGGAERGGGMLARIDAVPAFVG